MRKNNSNNIYNFYKEIYRDNKYRIVDRRNLRKDIFLYLKNKILRYKEIKLLQKYYSETYPIIFIVGVPRAGTTLLSQFIVDNFEVGYINNFVAKYWLAPLYATIKFNLLQKDISKAIEYESFLGNTKGHNSPHEFGYFWQYWADHKETDELSNLELEQINWEAINKELYSISNYLQKPLLIKNPNYIDYKILWINKYLPNSYFIYIKRKPEFTIQSIYEARQKRYGNPKIWWSIRPKNTKAFYQKEPIEQIAYQYFDVTTKIEKQLSKLSDKKYIVVSYEKMVNDIKNFSVLLSEKMALKTKKSYTDIRKIKNRNKMRLSEELFERILEFKKIYQEIYSNEK